MQEFTAPNSWMDQFKKRHNLSFKSIYGESNSMQLATIQEWIEKTLPSLVDSYSKGNIFNAGETGLFFNLFSGKTYTVKGENCYGEKMSKMYLTVCFCINSHESEKLTPALISKAEKLCFKNMKSLPTDYDSNTKAWMSQTLFEDFPLKLD